MPHRHTIHRHHFGWDNSFPSVVRIAPGETLEFEVADSAAGQLTPSSTVDNVSRLEPAVDAYMLCSVCGDLRISEIVDLPNWTVSFYFPRVVLD
jgi:acetamidase/formamidase